MAKKISKHSRAARRNEIEEPEAKSLSKLPRAEKTDLTSAIIRATAKKNEDLLNQKMTKKEQNKVTKKKSNTQLSNISKDKLERALQLTDKLTDKIEKSKERARQVQTARKSNWDSINSQIKKDMGATTDAAAPATTEVDAEDAMVEDFYGDDQEEATAEVSSKGNAFALLDEVEA